MNLTAANGKEMSALDVLSGVFKYLRDRLLQYIAMCLVDVEDTDIQWIITVSDDWGDAAKYLIREAANLVRYITLLHYKLRIIFIFVCSSNIVDV